MPDSRKKKTPDNHQGRKRKIPQGKPPKVIAGVHPDAREIYYGLIDAAGNDDCPPDLRGLIVQATHLYNTLVKLSEMLDGDAKTWLEIYDDQTATTRAMLVIDKVVEQHRQSVGAYQRAITTINARIKELNGKEGAKDDTHAGGKDAPPEFTGFSVIAG